MHPFSAEILQRFPEIQEKVFNGDEDLPYLMANHLANWLAALAKLQLSQQTIDRVVDFHRWCREQPEGKTAEDDISTIEMVGFLEKLFEHADLTSMVPRLIPKEELLRNHKYFIQWIGKDRYDVALRSFDVS